MDRYEYDMKKSYKAWIKEKVRLFGFNTVLLCSDDWLSTDDLDERDIATAVSEFMLAGIHTTAYTFGFLLYHLAINQQVHSSTCQSTWKK